MVFAGDIRFLGSSTLEGESTACEFRTSVTSTAVTVTVPLVFFGDRGLITIFFLVLGEQRELISFDLRELDATGWFGYDAIAKLGFDEAHAASPEDFDIAREVDDAEFLKEFPDTDSVHAGGLLGHGEEWTTATASGAVSVSPALALAARSTTFGTPLSEVFTLMGAFLLGEEAGRVAGESVGSRVVLTDHPIVVVRVVDEIGRARIHVVTFFLGRQIPFKAHAFLAVFALFGLSGSDTAHYGGREDAQKEENQQDDDGDLCARGLTVPARGGFFIFRSANSGVSPIHRCSILYGARCGGVNHWMSNRV